MLSEAIKEKEGTPARVIDRIKEVFGSYFHYLHIVTFVVPFGCVPSELENVYPLSQYETSGIIDQESLTYAWNVLEEYLHIHSSYYNIIILFNNTPRWNSYIERKISYVCQKLGYHLFIIPEKIYASSHPEKLYQTLKEIAQNILSQLEK